MPTLRLAAHLAALVAVLALSPLGSRAGPDRDHLRHQRRVRIAAGADGRGVHAPRQPAPRRQGDREVLRLFAARRRQGTHAEAQARLRAPVDAVLHHVDGEPGVRTLRHAVPDQGSRPPGADRADGVLADDRARHRKEGLQDPGPLGERVPADHQQRAPDRQAGRSQGDQAAGAGRRLAGEDVQAVGREPDADGLFGGLRRPADRRDRRPGEPLHQHLRREVPGGAEIPLGHQPRLHALLPGHRNRRLGRTGRRT